MQLARLVSLDRRQTPDLVKLCSLLPRSNPAPAACLDVRWKTSFAYDKATSSNTLFRTYRGPRCSLSEHQPSLSLQRGHRSSHGLQCRGLANGVTSKREVSIGTRERIIDRSSILTRALVEAGIAHAVPEDGHGYSHHRPEFDGLSLEGILASYIRHNAHPSDVGHLDQGTTFELARAEALLLANEDCTLKDIETWALVLVAEDSIQAAETLRRYSNARGINATPWSVLSVLLARPHVGAVALRLLIDHVWIRLRSQQVTAKLLISTIRRLLRHARKVWPAAIESIAALFVPAASANGLPYNDATVDSEDELAELTQLCNRVMHFISLPCSIEPFRNASCQEAGQVHVLEFMTNYRPSLQVDMLGYRAVARVQLAQGKTEAEQRWAKLKTKSWPPWKEDRTGMDTSIGPEHGVSRAAQTLLRMREAGYPSLLWEDVATLYTGWDTDGSPAIQTRAMLRGHPSRMSPTDIWAARVRTTRTVREAWACFLSYEDADIPPNDSVYLAMFEKLHFEEKRRQDENSPASRLAREVLPGDGKEVSPPPPSSHQVIYTRSEPPTLHRLFHQMLDRGCVPGVSCVSFLVRNASTLELGIEYLRSATEKYPTISALMSLDLDCSPEDLPGEVSEAFIQLLCRFSHVRLAKFLPFLSAQKQRIIRQRPINLNIALGRALYLVLGHKPKYRPPWNSLLQALSRSQPSHTIGTLLHQEPSNPIEGPLQELDAPVNTIMALRLMRKIYKVMTDCHIEPDSEAFYRLCIGVENAAIASRQIINVIRAHEENDDAWLVHGRPSAAAVAMKHANETLRYGLRTKFEQLVGEDSLGLVQVPFLPRLLVVPNASTLHAYIRALGWMGDFDGVLQLLRWMQRFRSELQARKAAHTNGDVVFRRAIIAVRVFLEQSWIRSTHEWEGSGDQQDQGDEPVPAQDRIVGEAAPPAVVREAQDLVEAVEEWDGWPSDEETELYCQDKKFA